MQRKNNNSYNNANESIKNHNYPGLISAAFRAKLYRELLTLLYKANSEHIGSSLSCLDILTVLFFSEMGKTDKFILSKGHAVPSLYVILYFMGKMSRATLYSFHKDGTTLPAHPPQNLDRSIPFHSGSLGHGLSLSCGIAESIKLLTPKNKKVANVYCLISDGECNEGQVWEAAQYATKRQLGNLIVLIDKNKLQAFGRTSDVLGDSASVEKWKSFGFETYSCNGHEPEGLQKTFDAIRSRNTLKPKVIICDTIKGFGVSFMENKLEWHYHRLTDELYKKEMKEIDARYEN